MLRPRSVVALSLFCVRAAASGRMHNLEIDGGDCGGSGSSQPAHLKIIAHRFRVKFSAPSWYLPSF